MAEAKQSGATQILFSVFLGLMVTTFVGVGVYTFHPPPQGELSTQIEELDRQVERIQNARPPGELTPADRDEIQRLTDERNEVDDAGQVVREAWGRWTSIILIIFATITMVISLVRGDRLSVLTNGLLLGGVFTMLYGVGWIVFTDTSVTRFGVMTVALLITLGVGYARFVRGDVPDVTSATSRTGGEGLAEIERRVFDLEKRMNDAASVLGSGGES